MLFLCSKLVIMLKFLSALVFKILGWSVVNHCQIPDKCVIIAAPHTSNWDFLIGRCYWYLNDVDAKYFIKSELFLPFLGELIKLNGGIPVYRKSKNNVVDQMVNYFNNNKNFILGMSPEGTRKKVDKWKTGFYHIALKAKVPIVLLKLDYSTKEVGVFNLFLPNGNFDKDMLFIQNKYENFKGKNLKNYNKKIF